MRAPIAPRTSQLLRRTFFLAFLGGLMALSSGLGLGAGTALPTPVAAPHVEMLAIPSASHVPSTLPAPGPIRAMFPPARPLAPKQGLNVDPTKDYGAEPAPMGIADFGVSGSTAYTYSTSEWLGNYSWTSICINGCGPAGFTVQENVVLQFVQGGQTYDYWIQDVAEATSESGNKVDMGPTADGLGFIDNIWNFSSSSYVDSGFSGNGTLASDGSYVYYYDEASSSLPGATATLSAPNNFYLLVTTHQNAKGEPVVIFGWNDGFGWVGFDTVTFTFATAVTNFQQFYVDGTNYNAGNLFTDGELDQGGPGGGSSVSMSATTNVAEQLEFWNGHNFQNTPSAWNFGGDTGETISSVQSIPSQDGYGTPTDAELNGTTRDATPGQAYLTSQVGTLVVWNPSYPTGTVAIGAKGWPYVGGWTSSTLVPGTYPVWDNATGGSSGTFLGYCTVTAGSLLNVTLSSVCPGGTGSTVPLVSNPTASSASADVGQAVTFTSTLVSAGSGGDTYAWTTPAALGCTPSVTLSITCHPTSSNIYTVVITVTDSASNTGTGTLSGYKVYPTPTVAVPVGTPGTVNVGTAVTFASALGLKGSGTDTYSWAESPAVGLGCPGSTTLSMVCTPTAKGTYTVTITVTDSNLGTGSNSSAPYVVTPLVPVVTVPVAGPYSSTDVGMTVWFNSTLTSAGAGQPVTYAWTMSPASGLGCAVSTTLSLECTPTTAGTYSITITATDNAGDTGSATLTPFTVNADPALTGISASPSAVDVSQKVTFTATVASQGAGTDVFAWTASSGLGCGGGTTSTDLCSPTVAGTYTVDVKMTDAVGGTATATTSFTVTHDPTVTDPTPSPAAVTVGQTVTWTTTSPFTGTGSDTYTWDVSPASGLGCASSSTATLVCTPTAVGTYVVSVTVTDLSGFTDTASSSPMTVTPAVPLSATITSNVTSGYVSLSVAFTATAAGGTGPYTYQWNFGDGGRGSGLNAAHTFTTIGTFTVTLFVNDSAGHSVTKTLTITTTAAPSPPPPPTNNGAGTGFLGSYGLLLILGAVVVVGVLAAVLASRRKRSAPPPPPDEWSGVPPPPQPPA